MPTSEAEVTLLNRILDEIKGLREDFRSLDGKHGALDTRVARLEEDRAVRDKAAQARIALVCAFGVAVVSGFVAMAATVYGNAARIDTINSYGTAYGRGKEDVFNRRFEEIERRLPQGGVR